MTDLVLRCSVGEQIGLGHLKRCLVIADEAKHQGVRTRFALEGSTPEAPRLLHARGHEAVPVSEVGDGGMLLLDIVHPLQTGEGLRDRLLSFRRSFAAITFIDGLPPVSFAAICDGIVDLLVVPYLGPKPTIGPATELLFGPEWAPMEPSYRDAAQKPRVIRQDADRLLITMGGSDPTHLTVKALAAARGLADRSLDIHVVLGPLFSEALRHDISAEKEFAQNNHITLLDAPASLATEMLWCDVAFAATGLTKYELALTGTPSLQVSLNRRHAEMNEAFAQAGTARHLGPDEAITVSDMSESLASLMDDIDARRSMSEAGRRLVDGRGADRLLKAMKKVQNRA